MHNNDYAHDLQNVNACLRPRCYSDKAQVEAHFRPFGGSANLDTR